MARRGENIYKRKDGRWEGRFIKGRKADGRPHYGYVYGQKYREVRSRLMPLKSFYADPNALRVSYWGTLHDWARCYMEEAVGSRIRPSTYAYYHGLLYNHILPELGGRKLVGITRADVREFADSLGKKGLGANSVRGVIAMLNRVMKAAVRRNILLANPCADVDLPAKEQPQITPMNRADQQRLELAAVCDKDGLAVLLALYTGMRIGEICALRWEDIDFQGGLLHVRRTIQRVANHDGKGSKTILIFGKPKSAFSARAIPLTAKLKVILAAEMAKSAGEYVVNRRSGFVEPRTVRYRYRRIIRAAGIPALHFHGLRHTFATRCIETGMDVAALSRILGHSSIKMTLDIYTGATMEHRLASIQKLDNIYDKPTSTAAHKPSKKPSAAV